MFYVNFVSQLEGTYAGNMVENIKSSLGKTVLEESLSVSE
jgi:hypothetical protein